VLAEHSSAPGAAAKRSATFSLCEKMEEGRTILLHMPSTCPTLIGGEFTGDCSYTIAVADDAPRVCVRNCAHRAVMMRDQISRREYASRSCHTSLSASRCNIADDCLCNFDSDVQQVLIDLDLLSTNHHIFAQHRPIREQSRTHSCQSVE